MDTGVYMIENVANGRKYVGSAVSLAKRWKQHRIQLLENRHHSRFLQRAWNKYGPLFFRFQIVAYCDRDNLLFYEQRLIDGLKPDYNVAPVAGSMLGYRHTEEGRRKMSIARRRNPSSPRKGVKLTEEIKQKISQNRKGKGPSVYSKERIEKAAAGMRKAKSVMTPEKVAQVRLLRETGMSAPKIAAVVGCTQWVVYDIFQKRTFKETD